MCKRSAHPELPGNRVGEHLEVWANGALTRIEEKVELNQQPSRTRFSVIVTLSLLSLLAGCTFVRIDTGKQLVSEDDPVFDTRFREVDPADLDLSNFWVVGEPPPSDEAIPINHRTYAKIVNSVSDGIVNLYTTVLEEREARLGIVPGDLLPFQIPIVSPVLDSIPFQMPIPYEAEGFSLGSGFLINEGGFILTNAHVIHNATDIRVVRAKNRDEFPARIIGVDPATDTALIRIEPQPDMQVLTLGNSGALEVGEIVMAVGNPLGLNHTVSSGLISAKERLVSEDEGSLLDYLQTDTAINPGSSGGPLLNLLRSGRRPQYSDRHRGTEHRFRNSDRHHQACDSDPRFREPRARLVRSRRAPHVTRRSRRTRTLESERGDRRRGCRPQPSVEGRRSRR